MAGGSNMMSKILLIGGSGYIGKFMVEASVKAGHPTFLLIRDSTLSNPAKSSIINKFKDLSVNLLVVRQILFLSGNIYSKDRFMGKDLYKHSTTSK